MNRVLVSIGPVSIYWYSFLILVAVIIGYQIAINYSKKINYHYSEVIDLSLFLVIWSIIGARIYYVLFHFDAFEKSLFDIFAIWRGGLAIYGAIIGGSLYVLYYCYKKKINFIRMLDIFS